MPETRIVAKLLATTAVTDLVGDRIRQHHRLESWAAQDAITFTRVGTDWSHGAGGTTVLFFVRVQLDLWSATPTGLRTLAAAVRGALNGWTDTAGDPAVSMCHMIDEQQIDMRPDSGEEQADYRAIQEYLLTCNE